MDTTLPHLLEQKNAAYEKADQLQRRLDRSRDIALPKELVTITWYNKNQPGQHTGTYRNATWADIAERINALRANGAHHIFTTYQGDDISTTELQQQISEAFDEAANWEAQIQAHRNQQNQPAAAA